MKPQFLSFGDDSFSLQAPFDVTVVMPTVLRETLAPAIESVYAQQGGLRIQILLGVDAAEAPVDDFRPLFEAHPTNCVVQVLYPGYSTSVRHGGLHPARDGGALRSVLTYLANSRLVAYLDDDNWYGERHLAGMHVGLVNIDHLIEEVQQVVTEYQRMCRVLDQLDLRRLDDHFRGGLNPDLAFLHLDSDDIFRIGVTDGNLLRIVVERGHQAGFAAQYFA